MFFKSRQLLLDFSSVFFLLISSFFFLFCSHTFYFFTTDSLSISILLPLFISLSSILLSHLGAIPSGILGFPGPESSNVRLIVAWDSPEAFRATALYCPASPAYEQNIKMDFNRRLGLTRSVPRHHLILPRVSQRLLPVYKI